MKASYGPWIRKQQNLNQTKVYADENLCHLCITCTNFLDSVVKTRLYSQFDMNYLALHKEKNTTSRSPLVISAWTFVPLSWARLMCYFIYFCVCICAYLFLCVQNIQCLRDQREHQVRTGITGSCDPPCKCGELNPGILQEQQVLFDLWVI